MGKSKGVSQMTPERSKQLQSTESGRLTSGEMKEGWHFCPEWDFMLVNMNDKEGEGSACTCDPWTKDQLDRRRD